MLWRRLLVSSAGLVRLTRLTRGLLGVNLAGSFLEIVSLTLGGAREGLGALLEGLAGACEGLGALLEGLAGACEGLAGACEGFGFATLAFLVAVSSVGAFFFFLGVAGGVLRSNTWGSGTGAGSGKALGGTGGAGQGCGFALGALGTGGALWATRMGLGGGGGVCATTTGGGGGGPGGLPSVVI